MKFYKLVISLLLTSLFLVSTLPASDSSTETIEQRDVQVSPQENISLLKLEVVDRTARQSLPNDDLQAIKNGIIKQINSKHPSIRIISEETEKANATLRVFVDVFTAGNRALRFWVGFGAGKAHMRIAAEWLEGSPPQLKDSKEYQRFGAGSLRSGQTIELQMTELIGQYAAEFVSKHINQ